MPCEETNLDKFKRLHCTLVNLFSSLFQHFCQSSPLHKYLVNEDRLLYSSNSLVFCFSNVFNFYVAFKKFSSTSFATDLLSRCFPLVLIKSFTVSRISIYFPSNHLWMSLFALFCQIFRS